MTNPAKSVAELVADAEVWVNHQQGSDAVLDARISAATKLGLSLKAYMHAVDLSKLSFRQGGTKMGNVVNTPEDKAQAFYGKPDQISGESSEWHQKIVEANEAKRKQVEDLEAQVAELKSQLVEATKIKELRSSVDFLNYAATIQGNRAATYDSPEGERSMTKTVALLNTLRGLTLKTSDGWLLLTLLKLVRGEARAEFHADSAVDAVSYLGLYAEELKRESDTSCEIHEGF